MTTRAADYSAVLRDALKEIRQLRQRLARAETVRRVMAAELRNALSASLGRDLPMTMLFKHPTIEAIAQYAWDEVLTLGAAVTHVATQEDADPELAAAGEEQLAVLLAQEISSLRHEEERV